MKYPAYLNKHLWENNRLLHLNINLLSVQFDLCRLEVKMNKRDKVSILDYDILPNKKQVCK